MFAWEGSGRGRAFQTAVPGHLGITCLTYTHANRASTLITEACRVHRELAAKTKNNPTTQVS